MFILYHGNLGHSLIELILTDTWLCRHHFILVACLHFLLFRIVNLRYRRIDLQAHLVESTSEVYDNLASSVIVNDLEFSDVSCDKKNMMVKVGFWSS